MDDLELRVTLPSTPDARHEYWESRYRKGHEIYGSQPSLAARRAAEHLPPGSALLELGGAYGRNAAAFTDCCSSFSLIDMSPTAVILASRYAARFPRGWLHVRRGDFLKEPWDAPDAVFSNFVLHLLTEHERRVLFERTGTSLCQGALFVNSFLATTDADHGRGEPIEPGTFLHEVGRFNHFFELAEIEALHKAHGLRILNVEHLTEKETINGAVRDTAFWFVVARKDLKENA